MAFSFSSLLSVCVFFFFVSFCFAEVTVLDESNFDSLVDGSRPAFVEFYAPWCGHCQRLAPEYEIVGEAFKSVPSVLVAKVDCDANKDVCGKHGVTGYPTLKWFPKGDVSNPESYSGGRTADDIISFINQKAGVTGKIKKAPSKVVDLNDNNFDAIVLDSNKNVFVEFYAPWCGHCKKLAPEWEKLGAAFAGESEVVIAKLDADHYRDLGSKHGVTGFPTLIFFSKTDKEGEKYNGNRGLEDLVAFINQRAGTSRSSSGKLGAQAGLVAELDTLATGFTSASNQAELLASAKSISEGLTGDNSRSGKIYVRTMEKIISDGASYVANEISRLTRLLESGSITVDKVDEFTKRLNILQVFKSA
jgi:protein disulfide-isomerase-like protein